MTPWSHVPWCQGTLHPGMGLSDVGEMFGPTVEAWRVSPPGERIKEAQSLGREPVWSSSRGTELICPWVGGSERVIPRGEDQETSVLGARVIAKGDCQKRSSPGERVIPSLGSTLQREASQGGKPPLPSFSLFPTGTSSLPAMHSMALPRRTPCHGPPAPSTATARATRRSARRHRPRSTSGTGRP